MNFRGPRLRAELVVVRLRRSAGRTLVVSVLLVCVVVVCVVWHFGGAFVGALCRL